jgi:hypothetical protein
VGAQEALTAPDGETRPEAAAVGGTDETLARWPFVAVALAASALMVALSWRVFLFWDDFVFLGQAQDADLTRHYLTEPLFNHFSPVTRVINWLAAGHVAAHPWLVTVAVCALVVSVVFTSVWWLVAVFGRSWPRL